MSRTAALRTLLTPAVILAGLLALAGCERTDPALGAIDDYIEEKRRDGRIDTGEEGWKRRLPFFPEAEFAPGKTYLWHLRTSHGEMRIRLLPDRAPRHVANVVYLTRLGFYDGLTFHRVIPGFMAQGGCPLGNGTGSPGYGFEGEISKDLRHDRRGVVSTANSGRPRTDGSQFFITFAPTVHLDGRHTIFGEMVAGEDTLGAFERRGSRSGQTSERIVIEEARIAVE